jgi:hypothetical protein
MSEKKSLKDLIGPIEVTPSVTKQSSIDGTTKIDNEGAGLRVGTKYGNLNISKNKNTQSYSQDPSGKGYTTKYKGASYDKEFKVGDSSRINLSANVGKTKDPMGKKGTTKGGTLSFTTTYTEGGDVDAKVKQELKKETPNAYPFMKGLSPLTHLRKFFKKKEIIKSESKEPKDTNASIKAKRLKELEGELNIKSKKDGGFIHTKPIQKKYYKDIL